MTAVQRAIVGAEAARREPAGSGEGGLFAPGKATHPAAASLPLPDNADEHRTLEGVRPARRVFAAAAEALAAGEIEPGQVPDLLLAPTRADGEAKTDDDIALPAVILMACGTVIGVWLGPDIEAWFSEASRIEAGFALADALEWLGR